MCSAFVYGRGRIGNQVKIRCDPVTVIVEEPAAFYARETGYSRAFPGVTDITTQRERYHAGAGHPRSTGRAGHGSTIDHVTAAALGVEQTAWVVPWNKEKKDSGQQRRIAAARNLFPFVMQEA